MTRMHIADSSRRSLAAPVWLFAMLVFAITPSATLACRYTIRDIGFVDMQGPAYTLWMINANAELADEAKEWLGPCNVKVAVVSRSQDDHRAVKTMTASGEVDITKEGQTGFVLEGPDDRWLWVGTADDGPERERIVNAVVSSPLRDRIRGQALDTFAFIIAKDVPMKKLDDAVERLKEFEAQLPRSIDHPVRKIVVKEEPLAKELILLWSLGIPLDEQPAAAIVYGRGKRLDKVLIGDSATTESIATQLAFVGESCECETDRDWVNEPVVPMRWGPEQWEQTRTLLGFDPESPLVKAEVVRIIGKGIRPDGESDGKPRDDLAGMLLGYRETPLDDGPTVLTDEQPVEEAIEPIQPVAVDLPGPANLAKAATNKTDTTQPIAVATQSSRLLNGTMLAIALITLASLFGCGALVMRRRGAH